MSFRHLGFRDLQLVVAVAEHGSVSRAAEACSITQPALSERLKRIETMLGTELFERGKRGVMTTPTGRQLVRKASAILDDAAELDEIASSSRAPLTGPLKVGVIATLGPYLVPLLLPTLRRRYPQLELVLHEGLTESLMSSLHAGAVDVVIAAAPLRADGIEQIELFEDPFVLAVPVGHDFADLSVVDPGELRGDDMVLLEDGHCLSGQALDVCPAKKKQSGKRLHAMSLETLRHMVAAGAGYTLLPSIAVGKKPPLSKLIRYISLAGDRSYVRKIVMAWRRSYSRADDLALLAELIRAVAPDSPKQDNSP